MIEPKCKQNRHDCFSCDENGRCHCLSNTEFRRANGTTYKCPFYKPRASVENLAEIKALDKESEND